MSLTNAQYESIMRSYQKRQIANHHLWITHRETVYEQVPGFRELDESIRSASLSHARKLLVDSDILEGRPEKQSMDELNSTLASLSSHKKKLLAEAGFPEDYLEPIYDCMECKDTGYKITPTTQGMDSIEEAARVKCRCFRKQEISLLYKQSNIQEMIDRENFTTLSYDYYQGEDLSRFRETVTACLDFVRHFPDEYCNLFFYGTVGTGKSFLSGCIAREILREGHPVIYFSSPSLFELLAKYSFHYQSFDSNAKETLNNFYEDLYNCELVIIDDLGTELTNAFVNSQMFSFLNERHLRKKATIISTNLSLDELALRYSDRIFSRITSYFQLFKLSGPDIRMLKKRIANKR